MTTAPGEGQFFVHLSRAEKEIKQGQRCINLILHPSLHTQDTAHFVLGESISVYSVQTDKVRPREAGR